MILNKVIVAILKIQMQLRVPDDKKRAQYKFKENEGLQFAFDIEQDRPEEVVQQMIEQQHIPDSDTSTITKLIRDKVEAFKRDREYRQTELKRQKEEEERKAEEAAVKEEIKARREREKQAADNEANNSCQTLPPSSQSIVNVPVTNVPETVTLPTSAPPNVITAQVPSTSNVDQTASVPDISAANQQLTAPPAKKPKKKIIMEVKQVLSEGNPQQSVCFFLQAF